MKDQDSSVKRDLSIASQRYASEGDYWMNKLSGQLVKSFFPYDVNTPAHETQTVWDEVKFKFSDDMFARLMKLSNGFDYTLHMIFTAAVVVLLHKYSQDENRDIIIGAPIYKQDSDEEFINTVLALRNQLGEDMTCKELLLHVRQTIMEADENQNYPLETLLYHLDLPDPDGHFPLFDAAVLLDTIHERKYLSDIALNMVFFFTRKNDAIAGTLEYNSVLYHKTTVERIMNHFLMVQQQMLDDIDGKISGIHLLTGKEKQQLLEEFNDTALAYPKHKTLIDLFADQVRKNGDGTAVVCVEQLQITYRELNEKSDRLAGFLREKGVLADDIVAIMVERSVEMIIGIIGIIKAGGAYLPIDPDYARDRIDYISKDSKAKILLDAPAVLSSSSPSACQVSSTNLAYVLYTSGSTGEPKAAMIRHGNVHNLILGLNQCIYRQYGEGLKVALVSPYYFDASVKQIFGALLLGHCLHIVPENVRVDGGLLMDYFAVHCIDVSDGTPTHLRLLLESCMTNTFPFFVRHFIIGGEALPKKVVEDFFDRFDGRTPKITNIYGVTECTVDSTFYEITGENLHAYDTFPIGKPMPNSVLFILDRENRLQPVGIVGELCIAGDGVGQGYMNRPELTAEKFVDYRSYMSYRTYSSYKTGDLARWLADGNIEFAGRIDHQVKIRGYRLELGEIESRLLRYEKLRDAVVVARVDRNGDSFLCAYVVWKMGKGDAAELRAYLSGFIPDYMIPAHFIDLEGVPLTANGKVNRRALPEPEIKVQGVYIAPRDSVEEKLVEIWSGLLDIGCNRISIDANFFELGGHSLKATILIAKIHKVFDTRIPLQAIFKNPTVRGISGYIKHSVRDQFASIRPVEEREYFPLSSAQKRLYVVQEMDLDIATYTTLIIVLLEGEVDADRLRGVFLELLRRHESLRTWFEVIEGEPRQRISRQVSFELEEHRMAEAEGIEFAREAFSRPFVLCQPPLLRVGLIEIKKNRHIMVIGIHHIIADGASVALLMREFMRLYEGESLLPLRLRYVDYSHWHNSEEQQGWMKKQEQYWLKQFETAAPKLLLSTDFPRPALRSFAGSSIEFRIGSEETRKIKELVSQEDVTMYMFLLAVFNVFLFIITGQEDILVGTPVANRRHADLEPIVGMFANIVVMRNAPQRDRSFRSFLQEARKKTLAAFDNQDYQFEDLVDRVMAEKDITRHSLFDVLFSLQNMGFPSVRLSNLQVTPVDHTLWASRADLVFVAFEDSDGSQIQVLVEYSTKLFKPGTIRLFITIFNEVLAAVLENADTCLQDIEVSGGDWEERRKEYLDREKEREEAYKQEDYIPPRDPCQEKLAVIWSDVLKKEKETIGINTDFFKIGGNSLKASTLVARIHQEFEVRIPLKAMFASPTIRQLAQMMAKAEKEKYIAVEAAEKKEYYGLSSAQMRLFILDQQGSPNTAYNTSSAVKITGPLHRDSLEQTFHALLRRHESLRTSFHWLKGEPLQIAAEEPRFKLEYFDLTGGKNLEQVIKDFVRPFDLSQPPLFRVGLIKLRHREHEHLLVVDMHHIIADGVSVDILVREFLQLAAGKELQGLRVQYKDFSQWEKRFFAGPVFQQQENFWLETLRGELPHLQMPLDFRRPGKQTFSGKYVPFTIPGEVAEKLNILAEESNVTLNILFLSIYFLLLYKYSNQEDIIVASVVSGRNHADLEHVIGMFANSLPLRNRIDPGSTFLEFLVSSGQRILAAYENRDYPLEKMIDLLNIPVDFSRNPIFDTMLAFHNELNPLDSGHLEIAGLEFTAYPLNREAAKFDFKMDVVVGSAGELACSLEYNTHLFKEETSLGFIRHFQCLIDEVLAKPGQKIADIDIFTEEEKLELSGKRKLNTPAKKKSLRLVVSATFTSEPIEDYILWWGEQFGLDINLVFASYNQVFQELLDEESLLSSNRGINLLLIRFEDWIRDLDEGDEVKCSKLEKNFQDLTRIITNKETASPYIVGLFPVSTHLSLSRVLKDYLEDLNRRWKKLVEETKNFYALDFTRLEKIFQVGEVFDVLMDKEGHLPFTHEYYAASGTRIAREVCALTNPPFKVIVLDCDNTLWKGVCGEDGALGVKVELAYLHLQRLMLQKYDQGMLLALCSKNNEADVREVFARNPGMLLKEEHFVDWKINWQPKSRNLKELARDLNLGIDSFIFIDDSPVECAEVMSNCPEVLTLCLPGDVDSIPVFLEHVWALDKVTVTSEDKQRTRMYRAEKERRQAREDTLSLNDYLSRLELKTGFNAVNPDQVSRVSQLTLRTNQFNLSTIRREEGEIIALSRRPRTRCWVVEVSDRFGDYGLVGVVITVEKDDHLFIDTFLLSCRVLGRGVEQAILVCLKKYCRECGLTRLKADYYPTPKNKPFYEFLQRTWDKEQEEEDHTTYSLKTEQIPETREFGELYYQAAFPKELNQEPRETLDILADHTAVAVADIREAVSDYRNLGYTCGDIIIDPLQKVKLVMCHQPGFDSIELVSPLDRQSPTAYVVEKNRDIPYHLCYRVRDIRQILTGLEQEGIAFEIVSETKPAVLFDNKDVIFIQVRHVGLVEFLEHRDGDFNVNVNAGEETRHNALQIVVADAEAALKFYKYLGYSVIKTINDRKRLTVTLTKTDAGYIDLIVPGPTAVEECRFLDQNGPHPFRLVFFGLSPKNMENPAPAHYILFQSREQEYKQPDEKQAISISHHRWDVYGLDQDNLLHKNHLLPLRYCTAAKLLTLPLYKIRQPRLETVEYQEPRSELEVRLVKLWKEILRIETLGINTSFFKAGGNSLKAVMMLSKIEKELDAALSLREVFNHPTVKKLALYIENNSRKSEFSTLKPAEKRDRYPLSAAQKRLYFLQLMNPEDTTYNIPITLQLQGSIDIELMEGAYLKLVQRHESLRTSFRVVDGDPVQLIHDRAEFKIEYFNLAPEAAESTIHHFIRPFDLAKAPLMRVGLIKTGRDEHVFIVDMHHIVTDGISILLLVSEFLTLYNGGKEESLPGIAVRYRDYCLWQNNLLQRKVMKKQEVYWLEKFQGDIPVLRLPTDYPRPEIKSNKGAYAGFEIEPGTAERLRALAIKEDATMFMVILTIFDILLFKLSCQEDIIVGTVTAGRRHQDLENIVGMFINTLVLRNYPHDEKSFSQCLKEVRETTLEVFDNQDYQFEDLVGNVLEKRDPGRNPLFDVMFMFGDLDIISIPQFSTISAIGNKTAESGASGLNVQPYRSGRAIAKFDMLFTGTDTGEKLVFSIGYCADLFKKETIERFITYFKEIVSEVKDNESILLKDISISHNLVTAKSELYRDQESDFEF